MLSSGGDSALDQRCVQMLGQDKDARAVLHRMLRTLDDLVAKARTQQPARLLQEIIKSGALGTPPLPVASLRYGSSLGAPLHSLSRA